MILIYLYKRQAIMNEHYIHAPEIPEDLWVPRKRGTLQTIIIGHRSRSFRAYLYHELSKNSLKLSILAQGKNAANISDHACDCRGGL